MREIVFEWAAWRDIERIPAEARERILAAINDLASEPRPAGARQLRGAARGLRIRVGVYRVVYTVDDSGEQVIVVAVGHRSQIYRGIR